MAKAALATVVAWQFAVWVLDSPAPFYAPMAALLVVDRTMVRSIGASTQRVLAVVVGMSAAWLVGTTLGVHWWSMFPVIYFALLIARWRRLGTHGIQVPTMVLLSLLTVGGTNMDFTYLTIVETVAGGVIGVATNALVLAPLHIREPRAQVSDLTRRVCDLLNDISTGLRDGWDSDMARAWYDTSMQILQLTPGIHAEIETGRESVRFNPRDNLRRVEVDWAGYSHAVEGVRRGQWHVAGIARTLADAADEESDSSSPSQDFLERYAAALDAIAGALGHFGLAPQEEQDAVDDYLSGSLATIDEMAEELRTADAAELDDWPSYGALLLGARRLVRELQAYSTVAVVPTDSGPIRRPPRLVVGRHSSFAKQRDSSDQA